MLVIHLLKQNVCFFKFLQGYFICIIIENAGKIRTAVIRQISLIVDRCINRQAVLHSDLVIIVAIAGSRVNQTSTCIKRYEITDHRQKFLVVIERMTCRDILKVSTLQRFKNFIVFPAKSFGIFFDKFCSQNKFAIIALRFNNRIVEFGINRYAFRSRNSPRSSRPYNKVCIRIKNSLAIFDLYAVKCRW